MNAKKKQLIKTMEAGFTLTEMLIVIALIGGIMTLVGGNIIGKFNAAKVDSTKIQMKQLGVILDDFNRVCGFYPTTDQGLDALIKAPSGRECKNYDPAGFVKGGKLPKDAWGNDFLYQSDGGKYKVISLGADNKPGGDGNNKDIDSDEI